MKLFFRRFGQGFPVIILHGLFGLSDNWVTFGRMLGTHFDVIIPDLRNHGQSPHHPVFSYNAMAEDIGELMAGLGLQEVMLIGHSLGGKIAMMFALRDPAIVKKLVVIDISLRRKSFVREHQQLIDAMLSVDFTKTHSRSDVEKQLSERIQSLKLRQFLLKNVYWRDQKNLDWRLNLSAINQNLPEIFDGVDLPGEYRGPALFVRGGRSDYIMDEDIPEILKKIPRAIVKTIEDASHWVHADAPGEFYEMVNNFLLSTVQP